MNYTFKTEDDQLWMVDVERMHWGKASSIISAPSVKAVESKLAQFVETEGGDVTPLGGGRYVLEGRQPKDGLCIVTILTVLSEENGGTCVTFAQGNVNIKDLQHEAVTKFRCECLSTPQKPQRPKVIQMPMPTPDTIKSAPVEG